MLVHGGEAKVQRSLGASGQQVEQLKPLRGFGVLLERHVGDVQLPHTRRRDAVEEEVDEAEPALIGAELAR